MYFSTDGYNMYKRLLSLDIDPAQSFFLWGPRQAGKSTLLKQHYQNALWVDLLKTDVYGRYARDPSLLRSEIIAQLKRGDLCVIDEVQMLPTLLNEVHWLIENQGIVFALSGSSARKVKRGAANLLGGRALKRELYGLIAMELGADLDLIRLLNHGYLPNHYLADQPQPLLAAYTGLYLKEEIAAEGLVRQLPIFSDFLNLAALSDTEQVNFSSFARDVGVSSQTIKDYYQILGDTLLGFWLPAYRKKPKRRIQSSPKFYFFDVGVVNFLAKRKSLEPGSDVFGKAFENWLAHELKAYNEYQQKFWDISFWKISSGSEVDFIINDMDLAIEAKATKLVNSNHLKGLRELIQDHPHVKRRIIVSLDERRRKLEDGIEVWPWLEFIEALWAGDFQC